MSSRLKSLFDELAELPPVERESRLHEIQLEDPPFGAELRGLLAELEGEDEAKADALIHAHLQPALRDFDQAQAPLPDIPGYRVLEEIGHGGMGSVYLAERNGEDFSQRVAIKLVRGFATAPVLERFRRERALLASLQHPNIARLYDGGSTAQGQPYLVMELIEGETLDRWCQRTRPDLRTRLRLLRTLCMAIQHAHQNLVLHRDLKPANVMVRADGEPVLLDFGVGKLLRSDAVDAADEPRPTTQFIGLTPAYASPEQLRGEASTTLSDVYGLGLILFELLCGEPLRANAKTTTRRQPSRVAARGADWLARDARLLRGELDTIVARALHEEPARRYPSAAALAEDLQAWSEGRPVRAVADAWHYRLRKFVGRHPLGVGFGSAGVLALLALSLWLAQALQSAREQALAAEQSAQFLVDLLKASAPESTRGGDLSVRDLLAQAEASLEAREFARPEVRARLEAALGDIHHSLGLWDAAERLLTDAVEHLRERPGHDPSALIQAMTNLARVQTSQGRSEPALAHADEALALARARLPSGSPALGHVLQTRGVALQELGRLEEAQRDFESARDLFLAAGPEHRGPLAATLHNLGWAARRQGDGAGARELLEQALAMKLEELGALHPSTFNTRGLLALVESEAGEFDAAVTRLESLLVDQRQLLGEPSAQIARTLSDLGFNLHDGGRLDEAAVHLQAAIAQHDRLGTTGAERAPPLNNYASLLEDQERFAEAEPLFRQSLAIRQQAHAGAKSIARAHHNLARLLLQTGRIEEARREAEAAWSLRRTPQPASHADRLDALAMLARVATASGDLEAAAGHLRAFDEALGAAKASGLQLRRRLEAEAELVAASRDFTREVELRRQLLGLESARLPPRHPALARQRLALASALLASDPPQLAEARQLVEQAAGPVESQLAARGPSRARLQALRRLLQE
jgi:Tfp pilus assembly protein PilF/predicted Ser/Thr protein kinase